MTIDTNELLSTPPAGTSRDLASLLSDMVSAVNSLISGGSPTVAALVVGTPSITVAAQSSTHRDATIQLKDGQGNALAAAAMARVWLSDTAGGAATASAPAGGLSFTAGTAMVSETANKVVDVISSAAGVITARLTHATPSSDVTWYVNVAIGNQIVSAAVEIFNA